MLPSDEGVSVVCTAIVVTGSVHMSTHAMTTRHHYMGVASYIYAYQAKPFNILSAGMSCDLRIPVPFTPPYSSSDYLM